MSDVLKAPYRRAPLAVRFAAYSFPEPMSGCWLWTAAVDSGGYGTIGFQGTTIKAHRASWLIHRGAVPDGAMVLHRCDMPCCVNPEHLFLGNQTDNMRDMVKKGRASLQRHPRLNPRAKLTPEDAAHIRAVCIRRDKHFGMSALAEAFGVSVASISAIVCGKSYPEAVQ